MKNTFSTDFNLEIGKNKKINFWPIKIADPDTSGKC
jgi:hypothetical protein